MSRILIWNNTGGTGSTDFGTAANWTDNGTGMNATSGPGLADEAVIFTQGAISGSGTVALLGLTGTGLGMTLTGRLTGMNTFVGGTVTMASGSLLASGYLIEIGDKITTGIVGTGPATLKVGAGATLDDTLAKVGALDILVGQNGNTGTLDVSGKGALATAGTRGFGVGDAGNGTIAVSDGGQLKGGNGQSQQVGLAVGLSGGTGTVTITGAGSGATFGDAVEIGLGGTGTLALSAGATLTAGDKINSLDIGDARSNANGTGAVSFMGADATLFGLIQVGVAGSGVLTLSGGSVVTTSSAGTTGEGANWSVRIGDGTAGTGTISVLGAGTQLTAGRGVLVGAQAHGALDVTGGTVTVTATAALGVDAFEAGLAAGASGVIDVAGGALIDKGNAGFVLGGSGSGTLNVSAGGHVSGGALTIASFAKSVGVVSVSGPGSSLTSSGAVLVGHLGAGSLSITSGGHLTAAGLVVSNAAGGSGTVSVQGAGSLLSTGTLALGSASAAGKISVGTGAHITASGAVSVLNGSLALSDGSFTDTGVVTVAAGGTITGSGVLSGASVVDLGRIGVAGGTLTCIGPLSGSGKLSIAGGDLSLHGTVASTLGVEFQGAGTLTTPGAIASTITGWAAGDVIDLTGISAASATLSGQVLSLFNASHALVGTLHFAGALATHNFTVGHDAGTGTSISFHA